MMLVKTKLVFLLVCLQIISCHGDYVWDKETEAWVWKEGENSNEDDVIDADNEGSADYDDEGDDSDDYWDEGSGDDYNHHEEPTHHYNNNNDNMHTNNNNFNDYDQSHHKNDDIEIHEDLAGPVAPPTTLAPVPLPPATTPLSAVTSTTTTKAGSVANSNLHPTSFFAQPGILAAVVGGAVVGLLCAILLVMFIVYRMRKKDEGSYALDEPRRSPNVHLYTKAPNREFFA